MYDFKDLSAHQAPLPRKFDVGIVLTQGAQKYFHVGLCLPNCVFRFKRSRFAELLNPVE